MLILQDDTVGRFAAIRSWQGDPPDAGCPAKFLPRLPVQDGHNSLN